MSVIGKPVVFGSGSNKSETKGFTWGKSSQQAYVTMADAYYTDSGFFDCVDGVFTCKKAGTYRLTVFGRGAYSSSGKTGRFTGRIVLTSNGTQSIIYAKSNIDNTGVLEWVSATLAAGDELYCEKKNTESSTTTDFGMIITV